MKYLIMIGTNICIYISTGRRALGHHWGATADGRGASAYAQRAGEEGQGGAKGHIRQK